MPPRLVPCHCCECGCVAYAVCDRCSAEVERVQLHRLMLRRGVVATDHPANDAFDELIASYQRDSYDREAAAAPGMNG